MRRKGAVAFIIWKDKILLFHRDNIQDIPHPDCWSLPGGGLEKGETSLEALRRELVEEVNYSPKVLELVLSMKTDYADSDIFIALVDDSEAGKFKHVGEEGQAIGFFTIDEAIKLNLVPLLKVYKKIP